MRKIVYCGNEQKWKIEILSSKRIVSSCIVKYAAYIVGNNFAFYGSTIFRRNEKFEKLDEIL